MVGSRWTKSPPLTPIEWGELSSHAGDYGAGEGVVILGIDKLGEKHYRCSYGVTP